MQFFSSTPGGVCGAEEAFEEGLNPMAERGGLVYLFDELAALRLEILIGRQQRRQIYDAPSILSITQS